MKRGTEEAQIQAAIQAAIGAEPDLILLRNVTTVPPIVDKHGRTHIFPVGLGTGSPDLVGILRVPVFFYSPRRPPVVANGREVVGHASPRRELVGLQLGRWFCLEVKVPGADAEPHQAHVHRLWRAWGAFVEVVHSVEEAIAALERARRCES